MREYRRCNHNGESRETGNIENIEGAIIMESLEKLAIYSTQVEDKQNKNTTQYVLDTNIRKQSQITLIIYYLIIYA